MAKLVIGTNSNGAVPATIVYQEAPSAFNIKRALDDNGTVMSLPSPIDLTGATDVAERVYQYAYKYSHKSEEAFGDAIVNADQLENISGSYAFSEAFRDCLGVKRFRLPALKTISGANVFMTAFQGSGLEEASLPLLETISGNSVFNGTFANTKIKKLVFNSLRELSGSSILGSMCTGCTQLKYIGFPALESVYGVAYFASAMLSGVTGCVVRFPAALESVLKGTQCINNGFNGTNTIILFDDGIKLPVVIDPALLASGAKVYWRGVDITDETEWWFDNGVNIIEVVNEGKFCQLEIQIDSTMTSFVLNQSDVTVFPVNITTNKGTYDSLSVVAAGTYVQQELTVYNNVVYACNCNVTASAELSGYYSEPETLYVSNYPDTRTIELSFVQAIDVVYTPSQIISGATFTTDAGQYYSYDENDQVLTVHNNTNSTLHFSAGFTIPVPENIKTMIISTEAYVNSESNYDFGFISIGNAQVDLSHTQIKNQQITNGEFVFRSSGLNTDYTSVNHYVNDLTNNVLTIGWGQDSTLKGTNSMYIKPIKIKFIPNE